jgi:hypothetical protein
MNWSAVGKQPSSLADPPAADGLFGNERCDNLELADKTIAHAVFVGTAFKNASLTRVNFHHSVFYDCYFRGAVLRDCVFTGCRFIGCEFQRTTMTGCDFRYAKWTRTTVPVEQVLMNLPEWENVRHALLQELRLNALSIGDGFAARRYLFRAMEASIDFNWAIVKRKSHFYANREKFGTRSWWKALGLILVRNIERYGWGYGEAPLRFAFTAVLWIALFGIGYSALDPNVFGFTDSVSASLNAYFGALRFSVLTFTMKSPTLELSVDNSQAFRTLVVLESMSGAVFVSILAAMVYRWISVRRPD